MKKNIYLILGMHRSVTSLTAKILFQMGIYMGNEDEFIKKSMENPEGFYELKKIVSLNDQILMKNNMTWGSIRKNMLNVNEFTELQIQSIINHLSYQSIEEDIAIKDPRLCILEDIWRKQISLLGLKEKVIFVFRNPYEVAMSLVKRNNIDFVYALKLWYFYNYCVIKSISKIDYEDYIIINGNEYYTNSIEQIKKISDFVQKDVININIINKKLHRNTFNECEEVTLELHKIIFDMYEYLLKLSNKKNIITNNDIDQFNFLFLKIYSQQYTKNATDFETTAFKCCHSICIKDWCHYQMENKANQISIGLNKYFKSKKINTIFIYGYGTLAKSFLNIIENLDINCIKIFDKTNTQNVMIKGKEMRVCPIDEGHIYNGYLINTAVNYEDDVFRIASHFFHQNQILSLFSILYDVLECK